MIYALFFVLSLVADHLTIVFHKYRETKKPAKAAGISGALELLGWLPVIVAIQTNDLGIMVASVLGASAGTYLGMRR